MKITLFAEEFQGITNSINELFKIMWLPLVSVAVAAAALLGLWMGIKFWTAGGDEAKIKKAKESVKYFVIGIVAIFLIAGLTPLIVAFFRTWAENQQTTMVMLSLL